MENPARYTKQLDRLGIKAPKLLTDVDAVRLAALNAAASTEVDDLRTDVIAGKLDAKTIGKRVREAAAALVAREKARDVLRDLLPSFDKVTARAVRDSAPDVIAQMTPMFDSAVADVVLAVDTLGLSPSSDEVLAIGGDAAAVWAARNVALDVLDAIERARSIMAQVGYGTPHPLAVQYLADPVDDLQLAESQLRAGWTTFASSGYTLNLNTAEEADTVLAASRARAAKYLQTQRESDPRYQANKVDADAVSREWGQFKEDIKADIAARQVSR